MWKCTSNSGDVISLVSSFSSSTRAWTNESEFPHDIDMLHGRCVHINGKLFWMGIEHGDDDGFDVYFVVSYDTDTYDIARHDFFNPENGFCEAITTVGDKITPLFRVSHEDVDEDTMQLWISQSEVVPNVNRSICKDYSEVQPGFNYIGYIGTSIFCSPPHSYRRGNVRFILFLHGGDDIRLKKIKGTSPSGFYVDFLTEHYHAFTVF